MKTTYPILLSLVLFAMESCNKNDEVLSFDEHLMYIDAVHPASTRATATSFETGDKIGVYVTQYQNGKVVPLQISGNWANNVAMTYNGIDWTPAKKIFWSENKQDVYGYYPYMEPISIDENPFSIALDQSTEKNAEKLGGYEASDFLWAKTEGVIQTDQTVVLQFKHRCSKLIVKLIKGNDYEGDLPDNTIVYIHNVVPTATIDFTTGAVTKDIYGVPTSIKTRKIDNETYEAILIPQRLTSRRPFVEVISNGVSYLLEDTFNFKAGKQHTLSLTINSNPDQAAIDIGGQIETDWK